MIFKLPLPLMIQIHINVVYALVLLILSKVPILYPFKNKFDFCLATGPLSYNH